VCAADDFAGFNGGQVAMGDSQAFQQFPGQIGGIIDKIFPLSWDVLLIF
jgi:hypothetical protein